MINLSFFEKKHTVLKSGRVQRASSIIRGQQIADYLGAKYNPTSGYENDVCIYIKPEAGTIFAKKSYIDLVDGYETAKWAKLNIPHPLIVTSQYDKDYLMKKLDLPQQIIVIPQHHCNYERIKRERKEITVVGYIGVYKEFARYEEEITKKLTDAGFEFKTYYSFQNRQNVVDFYKQIDIQLIWRPRTIPMKNCLKIVNAASFGIPTVTYPEIAFNEVEDYYISAKTIDSMIEQIQMLKISPEVYAKYSENGIVKAEEYHISNIAKLYKALCNSI